MATSHNSRVVAYDVATKTLKKTFPPTYVYTPDGITLGAGALAGYLFANTNDGHVVMMSAADPSIQQVIASGGSRGDCTSAARLFRFLRPAPVHDSAPRGFLASR